MTQGIKALRKIQIGQEVTAGGSTDPASTVWRGMGTLTDNLETTFPEEDIGILGGTTRSYQAKAGGEIDLEGMATFEQVGYAFIAGIYNSTATTDTGSGYIYQWSLQTQSTDLVATTDLQTLVIEAGDNNEAEIMRYCFVREINLSGTAGEAVENTITLEGREIAGGASYTSGVSVPTVETILVSKAKLYIDATSDTIGSTLVSQTLLGFDLTITTGWQPVFAADGRLDFSFIKRANDESTIDLTFEHNGTATAEKAAWRAETERAIRLKFEGNALSSAGAYTYKTLILDMYGKWESFEALSDEDGNDTVTGTFRIAYSPTAAKKFDITLVNELSALP